MDRWRVQVADSFKGSLKRYDKNHKREVAAVFANLEKYVKALNSGAVPTQIKESFVHPERKGVIAIDQTGCEGSPAETRLYIYTKDATVYLIAIGDKKSQQDDVNLSCRFVDGMRRQR